MSVAFHSVADIFPLMSDAEFAALKADIAATELREPIWLHPDGSILDGRNRYRACCEIGVKPEYRIYSGPLDTPSLVQFVVSLNMKRRHLDSGQKAFVALEVERVLAEAAKQRMREAGQNGADIRWGLEIVPNPSTPTLHAAKEAAKIVGTNAHYITDAKRITEQAPDLAQAVKNGEMKITEAKRELKHREKTEQREVARNALAHIEIREVEVSSIEPDTVAKCRIQDVKLPPESVDMIFTDPPYHDEHVELYEELARLADQVLKPGAYVMVYAGKMFLPEILSRMTEHLEYVSIFAVFQPFSKAKIMKHNIFENWRPIVTFKKTGRTATKEWSQDVVRGTRDKEFHDWQQDIQAPMQYIAAYTLPNDTVLDPFCGGGTIPAACKELGRHFIAFDSDEDAVRTTIGRLNGTTSIPQP